MARYGKLRLLIAPSCRMYVAFILTAAVLIGCQRTVQQPSALPDPASLLDKYEKSLLPYQHFKSRWICRYSEDAPGKDSQRQVLNEEWTVARDHDRAKLVSKESDNEGKTSKVFETVNELGKKWISVWSVGVICSEVKVSANRFWEQLGAAPPAPCYGVMSDIWIPGFLREAKLSARSDTLEGSTLNVLCGVSGDVEIEVWLDPSLDYVARRVNYIDRKLNCSRQFAAKHWRQQEGTCVITEATIAYTRGPKPMSSGKIVEKILANGQLVVEHPPAKDENGNEILSPARRGSRDIKLVECDFNPLFSDADFETAIPIANGTTVGMQDDPLHDYVWQDGIPVSAAKKTFPDAEGVLREGLSAAKLQHKKLLVQLGGPDCKPCHSLKQFFEVNKKLFDDEYVVLNIDLNDEDFVLDERHPERMIQKFLLENRAPRTKAHEDNSDELIIAGGGVPWMVILDGDGNELANSNGPTGNIGFPSNPSNIAYFVTMIQRTSDKPQERLDEIGRLLEQAAKQTREPHDEASTPLQPQ